MNQHSGDEYAAGQGSRFGWRLVAFGFGALLTLLYVLREPFGIPLPSVWGHHLYLLVAGLALMLSSAFQDNAALGAKLGAVIGCLVVAGIMIRAGTVFFFSPAEWLAILTIVFGGAAIGWSLSWAKKRVSVLPGMRPVILAAIGVVVFLPAFVLIGGAKNKITDIRISSTYIEMRDGVQIAASVWLPRGASAGTYPTILQQTRYHRLQGFRFPFSLFEDEVSALFGPTGGGSTMTEPMVRNGYVWVTTDVRGSGASTGSRYASFSPEEVQDGAEVLDWIVSQPWSDGRVGATGYSYTGTSAEFLASNQHPALKAVMPKFSLYDPYTEVLMPGGVLLENFVSTWRDLNAMLDADRVSEFFGPMAETAGLGLVPIPPSEGGPVFEDVIATRDDNWDIYETMLKVIYRDDRVGDFHAGIGSAYIRDDEMDAAGIPFYTIGGWLDGAYPMGSIRRFSNGAHSENRMKIGPWDHGGGQMISPCEEDEAKLYDHVEVGLKFFDYYLKGEDTGYSQLPPVEYFTMCGPGWQAAQTWPPESNEKVLYMAGGGTLIDSKPSVSQASDLYEIDLEATSGRASRWISYVNVENAQIGYRDRKLQDERLLVYDSEPLSVDTEITGHPIVSLQLAADAEDAQVFVYLEEVLPDGQVRYITEGQLRARHRQLSSSEALFEQPVPYRSFERADSALLTPGEPVELKFDLWPTSYLVKAGHRIRIAIAGADKDNFTQMEGGPTRLEVFRSQELPSHIVLPVVE